MGYLNFNMTTASFKRNDPAASIRQAGALPKGSADSAAVCMRPDLFGEQQRQSTPEHIRKYRQSFKQQPGIRQIHAGLYNDMENIDRN
jgi:hypothetical protein